MEVRFEWFRASDAARMAQAYALREAVFVDEQGFTRADDRDGRDETALHVLGRDEAGAVVCTARMFPERPGVWHAGRIAVRRALRGQGVGRQLAGALAQRARQAGARWLELGAQADKRGFYEAVGFSVCGEMFLDAGSPHLPMRMAL